MNPYGDPNLQEKTPSSSTMNKNKRACMAPDLDIENTVNTLAVERRSGPNFVQWETYRKIY